LLFVIESCTVSKINGIGGAIVSVLERLWNWTLDFLRKARSIMDDDL